MAETLKELAIEINVKGAQQAKASIDGVNTSFNRIALNASKGAQKINSFFGGVAKTALGFVGATGINKAIDVFANTFFDMFREAGEGEQVFMDLDEAIKRAGMSFSETKKELVDFADEMAKGTQFTDDQIIAAESLAISLGMSVEEIKKYFNTAADLAAAKGSSLSDALIGINKSLAGNAASLQKIYPDMKEFTEEQLKAGAAVDFLNERFGGKRMIAMRGFNGAILQLQKSWGDFLEGLGTPFLGPVGASLRQISDFLDSKNAEAWGKALLDMVVDFGAYVYHLYNLITGEISFAQSVFKKWWDEFIDFLPGSLSDAINKSFELVMGTASYKALLADMGAKAGEGIAEAMTRKILEIPGKILNSLNPFYKEPEDKKGAFNMIPSSSDSIYGSMFNTPTGGSSMSINQDVKIYSTGESAQALQRSLKATLPLYKTSMLA